MEVNRRETDTVEQVEMQLSETVLQLRWYPTERLTAADEWIVFNRKNIDELRGEREEIF